MKTILKKLLKFIKYTLLFLLVLSVIGAIFMHREGKRMYGALTDRVDSKQFIPKKGTFAIINTNLLSVEGDSVIKGQTILIEEGLITAIDSTINIPPKTETIDGSGKYVIPGLIDTHVHLFQSPNDLLLYLANGVTEIRELIGEEDHLKWREEINNGTRIGPKLHVFSPRLGSFEPLEGWFMEYSQGYENIKNAEEANNKVQEFYDDGYDGIKIYSQVSKEVYHAINEKANALGMPVSGHIPWSVDFDDVFKSGQNNIVHFEELMNGLSREFDDKRKIGSFQDREEEFLIHVRERAVTLANDLVKNDIVVTSTLWLTESFAKQPFELEQVLKGVELEYENPGISEWVSYIPQGLGWLPEVNRYKLPENLTPEQKENFKKYWQTYARACQIITKICGEKGVKIMAGTDANLPPAIPGFSLHDELISLNNAGIPANEVLKSATAIPANYLGSKSGKIIEGYEANLVLLDKNPLENISHTKNINSVIAKGRFFDRELLDEILKAVKEANDSSRKIDISEFVD